MPFRWRLILWFGSLFTLVLIAITTLSYAFHARGHYDDVDRALALTAHHTALEAALTPSTPPLQEGHDGFQVVLRIYDGQGHLTAQSETMDAVPLRTPQQIRSHPTGPAYDAIAGLAPPMATMDFPANSAFSTLDLLSERWRVFVQPLTSQQGDAGFVEAFTPLGEVDASMRMFQAAMVGLVALGVLVTMGGCWLVASSALQPITSIIVLVRQITDSHDLSQRLQAPSAQDEIGQLASTFNAMLASLQAATQTQQRFISDVSHELRAPLTAMLGNLDLVRRHPEQGAVERDEALAEAEREAQRLHRLVADMLSLARADAGHTVAHDVVDLDSVVLDAFQSARSLAQGQLLQLDPFAPVQVYGDSDRLHQLLVIVLDNAIKYTPAGKKITLGLGLEADSMQARITVTDAGVGIAAADIPHIFERFYRADPARGRDPGGTGLGLSIAQWIVEQHAGAISVTSHPGEGTIVTVTLPALVEQRAEDALTIMIG